MLSVLAIEYKLLWRPNEVINIIMITNFLIINCIGKNDKIGLKFDNNFYVHDFIESSVIDSGDGFITFDLNKIKSNSRTPILTDRN